MCLGRWFFVHDFAVRHGLGRFCVFDIDIMLYRPAEHFAAPFAGRIAGSPPVPFAFLHFQGSAKERMAEFACPLRINWRRGARRQGTGLGSGQGLARSAPY